VPRARREDAQTYDRVNNYRSSLHSDNTTLQQPIVIHLDTHQSHVLLGAPTYPIGHKYAAALALLCNILGGPGMNSRLGLELREHRGLVYTVESNINNYTDAGYLGIYFGCDHSDVNHCLKLCHKQLERFQNELLTPRQISNAKKQLGGQLGVAMANMENNAIALAKNLLRLGKVETLEQTCNRINSVTPELIQTVAREVFDKALLKTVIIQ
jgi:predicted Zn-dependent peptidase